MKKLTVALAGTPDIACPAFEAILLDERFSVQYILTQEDKPVGRKQVLTPPPVKQLAEKYGIVCYQPLKLKDIRSILESFSVDILLVMAYGKILPQWMLDNYSYSINIHASLLPKYRGASPIQAAIMGREKESGVSIMQMVAEMDAGGVYITHEVPLSDKVQAFELSQDLADISAKHIGDDLVQIFEGLLPQEQNHSEATYCGKISKQDALLDFTAWTAIELDARLRAFTPWPGGYFFDTSGKRIVVRSGKVVDIHTKYAIATKDGYFLPLRIVPEGKKEQDYVQYMQSLEG